MVDILSKDESYKILGACFEVYNQMGSGYLEAVYQECLEYEFEEQLIPAIAQQELSLRFKHRQLRTVYKPDFICYGSIIVELKTLSDLNDQHRSQIHNYLKSTGYRLGILVNFGQHPKLQYERIVR